MEYCASNAEKVDTWPYYNYISFGIKPFIVLLQCILFIHTLLQFKKYSHKIKQRTIAILYAILQMIGIMWTLHNTLKLTVFAYNTPHLRFNETLCGLHSYLHRIWAYLFCVVQLLQLFLRLDVTFKDSVYEFNQRTRIMLLLIVMAPICISFIIFVAFLTKPCYKQWNPSDLDGYIIYERYTSWNGTSRYAAYATFAWYLIQNINLGILFSYKLSKVLNKTDRTQDPYIEKTILKNTILTISMVASTLILWVTYFVIQWSRASFLMFIDAFLNCLLFGLMFKFNEHLYYNIFCKVCDRYFVERYIELELSQMVSSGSDNAKSAGSNPDSSI